jgi:hypothetical protein
MRFRSYQGIALKPAISSSKPTLFYRSSQPTFLSRKISSSSPHAAGAKWSKTDSVDRIGLARPLGRMQRRQFDSQIMFEISALSSKTSVTSAMLLSVLTLFTYKA